MYDLAMLRSTNKSVKRHLTFQICGTLWLAKSNISLSNYNQRLEINLFWSNGPTWSGLVYGCANKKANKNTRLLATKKVISFFFFAPPWVYLCHRFPFVSLGCSQISYCFKSRCFSLLLSDLFPSLSYIYQQVKWFSLLLKIWWFPFVLLEWVELDRVLID